MKPILLIGGYGGFGSRISRRLSAQGFEVLIAGRSRSRAEAFCRGKPGLRPVSLGAPDALPALLAEERPWAVVDAAGPFQGAGYETARAALAAGCHYLDISDAREFVSGIGALDELAREAGLCVISGASTEPALSNAVVRRLSDGLDKICAVEMTLSVTSRAAAGRSVTDAILSYAGRPFRIWSGGRWTQAYGWQGLRREPHEIEGRIVMRRHAGLIDVPSLDLLPPQLPGRPAVAFRASAELAAHNLGLWLASWPVRWGWLRSLTPFASLIRPLQRLATPFDSGRSAMTVRLFGSAEGRRLERRWTLIAEAGDGREIPCLALPLLLGQIEAGKIAPGARDAANLLSLADFEADFAALCIRQEIREIEQSPPVYERLMGKQFQQLPASVRRMHELLRDGGASGRASVRRGRNFVSRLIGMAMRFPSEGEHELHVHFEERGGVERWTRCFSESSFRSVFTERRGLLVERFGLIRFGFEVPGDASGLSMVMRRWWIGPIPLPLFLAPRSLAREWEEDGRFHFDVPVSLPGIGLLVHYRGWLEPL